MKTLSVLTLILSASFSVLAQAQVQNLQLERLISNSEQEVQGLKELIKKGDVDTQTLERATAALEKISAGIDKSIKPYQGTKLFTQALVQSQSGDDFSRTFSDVQALNKLSAQLESQDKEKNQKQLEGLIKDIVQFQKESVKANSEDLSNQKNLEKPLIQRHRGLLKKSTPK